MPVPVSFADLSTTPVSNSPAGSEAPSLTDDYFRAVFAMLRSISLNTATNGWPRPYFAGGASSGPLYVNTAATNAQAVIGGVGAGGHIVGSRNTLYLLNSSSSGNQSNAIVFGSAGAPSAVSLMTDRAADGSAVSSLSLLTGAVERFRFDLNGRLSGTALHNNATLPTGTAQQYIASGTYTPTLTGAANVSSAVSSACSWMRVGNVVTVAGRIVVTPTVPGDATDLRVSLPIPSDFTTGVELGGSASSLAGGGSNTSWLVQSLTATNDAVISTASVNSNLANALTFQFTYVVL